MTTKCPYGCEDFADDDSRCDECNARATTTYSPDAARGFGRQAARRGTPAGKAYREACRTFPRLIGTWKDFAAGYDAEKAEIEADEN